MSIQLAPDRLTIISRDTQVNDEGLFINNMMAKGNELSQEFGLSEKQVIYPKGRYRRTMRLPLVAGKSPNELKRGDPYLFIQASPFNESTAFLRIQFNGMQAIMRRTRQVSSILHNSLFKGVSFQESLYKNLLVTEFHVAFDTPEPLVNLWLDRRRSQITTVVYSRDGELQTVYQGDRRASLRVIAYNKRAELLSRQKKGVEEEGEMTRIEWRFVYRTKTNQPLLANLIEAIDMKSEFRRLTVYNAPAIKNSGILNDEIISFADHLGLKTILQSTDKKTRRRLRNAVKNFKRRHINERESEELINRMNRSLRALFRNPRKKQP